VRKQAIKMISMRTLS